MLMSKKGWIGSIFLVLLIVVGWWMVSPLFLDEVVDEDLPTTIEATTNAEETSIEESPAVSHSGMFVDGDDVHHASGNITSFYTDSEQWVRFENFEVTNGPDLYTVLVKEGQSTDEGTILGELKGNVGSQNYRIPGSSSLEEGDRIVVWCKAFEVDFGFAELFLKE
ncbi:DM13 domain-containing protein [Guptibacillus hwajinpoensis]|uniref:DM13 domain-containing protein n=1 Tax=Guptibacillus hwajinpoensis TaxID=208199 RepID=UPI001CFF12CC|nr:DM13 domain-containing protein [Pseudalkalibacillus hwajinpoensis]WLR61215.1 DM13 domain-containing protein [Pseudalkalibacillus hwajinpoensis]